MSLNHLTNGSVQALYLNPNVGNLTCLSLTAASQSISGNLNVSGSLDVGMDASIAGNVNLSGLNGNGVLGLSNSNNITSQTLNNGNLLIGSSGNPPVVSSLTGTANQVNVTNAPGSITLSLPQNIDVTSSPTFVNETLTGLSSNGVVSLNGSSAFVSNNLNNGQLMIGQTGMAALPGTLSQGANASVTIANGANSITLDAVQDIRTTANPVFNNMSLNGSNLNIGPGDGSGGFFVVQPSITNIGGSKNVRLLSGDVTNLNSNNAGDLYLDAGAANGGGGLNGSVLIGNSVCRALNIGRPSLPVNFPGVNNFGALTASNLVVTDGSMNLVSGGTLIYPSRVSMASDERLVISGNPLILMVDPLQLYNGYSYNNPPANGDSNSSSFYCQQGTYNVNILLVKNTNEPIITVFLDGVSLGTYDMYNASAVYNTVASFPSVTVTGYGRHTLVVTTTGQNGLSSGFFAPITKMWLTSTDTVQTSPNPL